MLLQLCLLILALVFNGTFCGNCFRCFRKNKADFSVRSAQSSTIPAQRKLQTAQLKHTNSVSSTNSDIDINDMIQFIKTTNKPGYKSPMRSDSRKEDEEKKAYGKSTVHEMSDEITTENQL
ncbi:hypothetical protein niasHT_008548 [Heterodera trifolii]|uniref:Effector protein n=1 Tax=Heterodera trifolii TaxID=157864 RepID=A0ABD2MA41_9BILA